jgi:autotransporter-associated beta strand protein
MPKPLQSAILQAALSCTTFEPPLAASAWSYLKFRSRPFSPFVMNLPISPALSSRLFRKLAIGAVFGALMPFSGLAQTTTLRWNGNVNALWDTSGTLNWLAGGTPVPFTNGASVQLEDLAAGSGSITLAQTVLPSSTSISNSSKSYAIAGPGSLAATAGITKLGPGNLTFRLGASINSTGLLAIGGGTVLVDGTAAQPSSVAGEVWVGHTTSAAASLILSNAVFTNSSWLAVGRGNGSSGLTSSLTLVDATNVCANLALGYWGNVSGNLQKPLMRLQGSSATLVTSGGINLGESSGSSATLEILDTSMVRAAGRVLLGMEPGATGTLSIANSGRLTNSNYAAVGAVGVGIATLKQNGIWQNPGDFNVADVEGSRGTLYIQDSAALRINTLYVGKAANSTGTVHQTGGTVTRLGGGDWRIGGNSSGAAGQYGVYNISAGTLDAGGANLQVGAHGIGFLNQSGGTVNAGGWPSIGRYTGSEGVLSISGGVFKQTAGENSLIVGEDGRGTLNLSGTGVADLENTLRIGNSAGGAGTVNLNGGTLITRRVYRNHSGATGILNFNGGVLRAAPGAMTDFLSGLSSANVLAGGAVLDSGAGVITIAQNLAGSGGLRKQGSGTITLEGKMEYAGNTIVDEGTLVLLAPQRLRSTGCILSPQTGLGVRLGAPESQAGVALLSIPNSGARVLIDLSGFGGQSVPPLSVTNLILNGNAEISVAGQNFATGVYPLLRYSTRGGSGGFVLGSLPVGMTAQLRTNLINQTIDLEISKAPETLPWQLKQAPIMTDWAQQVDPANVWPEYPRPQMVRSNWLNLNGVWQWQAGKADDVFPTYNLAGSILVPFCMESAISGVMEHHERAWYKRTFNVPAEWSGQRLLLHFEAVDWECEPFLNGVSLGVHRGGFDPFSFDITPYLANSGPQVLTVRVYDPSDSTAGPAQPPLGKQRLSPGGIWYTTCSGIWQTVWVEPVPANSILDIHMVPDIDAQRLSLQVDASGSMEGFQILAAAFDGTNPVSSATGTPGVQFHLPVASPKLWSPTNPFLYDLRLTLLSNSQPVDVVESYFGMRKISLGTNDGHVKMFLNNHFMFQFGPLDQGYWPDGILTPPSDLAMREDIEQSKALGFNFIRKHVKVEPRRWYYYTDKLGLVVWQDMPSMATGQDITEVSKVNFEQEMARMIKTHWNSPSIIVWTVFNEGWGQYDTVRVTSDVMALDSSRLINCASGWTYYDVGHMEDSHSYPDPSCPVNATRAVVNGEFGGVGLGITNHTWASGWGYVGATDGADLSSRFEAFCSMLSDFVQNDGLSAAVYTQITDVETELNGFYTYDRQVLKPDLRRIRAAVASTMGVYSNTSVAATSQATAQTWKYTASDPGTGWMNRTFNDSAWVSGPGGFGTTGTPGAAVGTVWNTSDIWLRRTFDGSALTPAALSNLVFSIHHDEAVEIYINGVLAASAAGYTTAYGAMPMSSAAQSAIMTGPDNVLAVHCHQTAGGQYIDVGIDLRTVLVAPPNSDLPAWVEDGTGLMGEYYQGTNFTGAVISRNDATLNFAWGAGVPLAGVPADGFSARWAGFIQPRYSEVYTFHLTANDGARLWVDGQLLVDSWDNGDASTNSQTGTILLEGGRRYMIRIDYYDAAGAAGIKLEWTSASQVREVVPQGVLFGIPLPRVTSAAVTNGMFHMQISGIPGLNYTVYASESLSSPAWVEVFRTNAVLLPFTFNAPALAEQGPRFYRVSAGVE